MEKINYKGNDGVFLNQDEYETLCEKILSNNELIKKFIKEAGLVE